VAPGDRAPPADFAGVEKGSSSGRQFSVVRCPCLPASSAVWIDVSAYEPSNSVEAAYSAPPVEVARKTADGQDHARHPCAVLARTCKMLKSQLYLSSASGLSSITTCVGCHLEAVYSIFTSWDQTSSGIDFIAQGDPRTPVHGIKTAKAVSQLILHRASLRLPLDQQAIHLGIWQTENRPERQINNTT
jgi:hypothetical protein